MRRQVDELERAIVAVRVPQLHAADGRAVAVERVAGVPALHDVPRAGGEADEAARRRADHRREAPAPARAVGPRAHLERLAVEVVRPLDVGRVVPRKLDAPPRREDAPAHRPLGRRVPREQREVVPHVRQPRRAAVPAGRRIERRLRIRVGERVGHRAAGQLLRRAVLVRGRPQEVAEHEQERSPPRKICAMAARHRFGGSPVSASQRRSRC